MKVLLIRYHDIGNINTRLAQSLNRRQGVLPPLGLAHVASALEEAGHEVGMIDAVAEELSPGQVSQRIRAFAPRVVGVTAMTPTFRGALEAARLAKAEGAITVMGGVHMSIFARETLENDCVDYGIIGEGEETMVELCGMLDRGGTPSGVIDGLCYRDRNGQVVIGAAKIVADITKLPWPAYHLLPMDRYSSILGTHPVVTMMGSRGCPYRCGFCFKTPSDKKYRTRDVADIVAEIAFLKRTYGIKEVMFYDDIMPQKYARDLAAELIAKKVDIQWQTPQRVNLVDEELLALMARSGCHLLRFGVEQGDPEMMQHVEKKTDIEQVKRAFALARRAGIDTFAYFIIGYFGETERTIQATIDLAIALDPRYVMFTKAVPLPNTPLMKESVDGGLVAADYWTRFVRGEDVPPIQPLVKDADLWVARAYRRFYLRPGKIVSQLVRIRSLRDLRKNIDGFVGVVGFRMRDDALTVVKSVVYGNDADRGRGSRDPAASSGSRAPGWLRWLSPGRV